MDRGDIIILTGVCPNGDMLLGGGCLLGDDGGDVYIKSARPVSPTSYHCYFVNKGVTTVTTYQVGATCCSGNS